MRDEHKTLQQLREEVADGVQAKLESDWTDDACPLFNIYLQLVILDKLESIDVSLESLRINHGSC
jgi:hypothetical protein